MLHVKFTRLEKKPHFYLGFLSRLHTLSLYRHVYSCTDFRICQLMLAKFKLTVEGLAKCYHWLLSRNSGYSHTDGCWVDGLNFFNCKHKSHLLSQPSFYANPLLMKSHFSNDIPFFARGENKHWHFIAYIHLDTECPWFFRPYWRDLGLFVFSQCWNGRKKMYIGTAVLLFHLTTEQVNDNGETILCGSRYRRSKPSVDTGKG